MPCRVGWGWTMLAGAGAVSATAPWLGLGEAAARDNVPAAAAPADPASDEDTLGLTSAKDRLSVDVTIDGRGPYPFVVDTGAERTVISRELATKLALKPAGSVMLHSMNSSGIVETALIPSLKVSRRPVTDIHAPALAAVNIGATGMLGTDTLQDQRVLLDFGHRKMTISRSNHRDLEFGRDAIVVTAKSLYGRLIVADARAEGEKVIVVIDTGSDVTIGNEALRRRLIGKQKLKDLHQITLISVLGDSATADYTALPRISIGGIQMHNMPIAFADVHLFSQLKLLDRPAILLGMDTLQLFDKVAIDFSTRRVQFISPYLSAGSAPIHLAAN